MKVIDVTSYSNTMSNLVNLHHRYADLNYRVITFQIILNAIDPMM